MVRYSSRSTLCLATDYRALGITVHVVHKLLKCHMGVGSCTVLITTVVTHFFNGISVGYRVSIFKIKELFPEAPIFVRMCGEDECFRPSI